MTRARLEVRMSVGCEHTEAVSARHAVVLNARPTSDVEVRFDGGAVIRGSQVPGTISVHPAGLRYVARRLGSMSERRQLVALDLAPGFLQRVTGTQRYDLVPTFGREDLLVQQLVVALEREARSAEGLEGLHAEALLVALVSHLTRQHGRPARGRSEGLREYIADRLDQSLTLDDLAAFAQCDVRSFTRWFKHEYGVSPHRYVVQARVERARALVLGTRKPLSEIALECGFSSQSHLTTAFQRALGQTPGALRRR